MSNPALRGRLVILSGVILLVGVLAFSLTMTLGGRGASEAFHGTMLNEPRDALDFALVDQHGQTVRLSEFRGRPVALTFLYTSCTDVCPFVGVKLKSAVEILGDDASNLALLVVSTDPERDTPDRIAEYSRELGMFDRWHYLIGSAAELTPVWDAYYIGEPVTGDAAGFATEDELALYGLIAGLDQNEIDLANRARRSFGGGYDVSHGTPVWLIGSDGMLRAKLDQAGTPEEWASDLKAID